MTRQTRAPTLQPTYERLRDLLYTKGWRTPNTYSEHWDQIPAGPGVYLFLECDLDSHPVQGRVLYVGMSTNLALRHRSHEVAYELAKTIRFFQTWFLPIADEGCLRSIERDLIATYNPPYNIVGRRRGV